MIAAESPVKYPLNDPSKLEGAKLLAWATGADAAAGVPGAGPPHLQARPRGARAMGRPNIATDRSAVGQIGQSDRSAPMRTIMPRATCGWWSEHAARRTARSSSSAERAETDAAADGGVPTTPYTNSPCLQCLHIKLESQLDS